MLYKLLVMLHVLGACIWIGGSIALVSIVLPPAMRERRAEPVVAFERRFGWLGLGALTAQLLTGTWLGLVHLGDLRTIFAEPKATTHLVLTKLVLALVVFGWGGYEYHIMALRLKADGLRRFNAHAWTTVALSVLLLVLGVAIRTGGLWGGVE
ncbi:MAG: hypothetical protein KDA22_12415 [Phycisphaerales bacterium]|nr:hypothetical protein [Phycisphaerales bacterium]